MHKRTACDKVIRDKSFDIAKNPKYYGYQRGLTSLVYTFLDKEFKDIDTSAKLADKAAANTSGGTIKSKIMSDQQLADELLMPVIR